MQTHQYFPWPTAIGRVGHSAHVAFHSPSSTIIESLLTAVKRHYLDNHLRRGGMRSPLHALTTAPTRPIPNLQVTLRFFRCERTPIPDSTPKPASMSVTGTSSGTATLVSTTPPTSADQEASLGIANASPENPIGVYLPSTQQFQPRLPASTC